METCLATFLAWTFPIWPDKSWSMRIQLLAEEPWSTIQCNFLPSNITWYWMVMLRSDWQRRIRMRICIFLQKALLRNSKTLWTTHKCKKLDGTELDKVSLCRFLKPQLISKCSVSEDHGTWLYPQSVSFTVTLTHKSVTSKTDLSTTSALAGSLFY